MTHNLNRNKFLDLLLSQPETKGAVASLHWISINLYYKNDWLSQLARVNICSRNSNLLPPNPHLSFHKPYLLFVWFIRQS